MASEISHVIRFTLNRGNLYRALMIIIDFPSTDQKTPTAIAQLIITTKNVELQFNNFRTIIPIGRCNSEGIVFIPLPVLKIVFKQAKVRQKEESTLTVKSGILAIDGFEIHDKGITLAV